MALVFDDVPRNHLQSGKQRLSLIPPMGLNETDDDVFALAAWECAASSIR